MVNYGAVAFFDHILIWVNTVREIRSHDQEEKPFKFESMWPGHAECSTIIKEIWAEEEIMVLAM